MSVRILFTSGQCLGQQRSEAQQSRPRKRERKFRVFFYIQQRIANGRMKAFQECVPYQNETFSFFPNLLLAISLCVAVIHCCYAKNLMTLLVNCLCRMMFDRHVPSIELVLPEYIYRVSCHTHLCIVAEWKSTRKMSPWLRRMIYVPSPISIYVYKITIVLNHTNKPDRDWQSSSKQHKPYIHVITTALCLCVWAIAVVICLLPFCLLLWINIILQVKSLFNGN